ncbi:ankyrin repeat-containing protein [Moelleriella libera RCEF 2490]|uniref:Ankyrin repeat-containing protein n=1 Tax=Moelleriella libera RCEF 2490 TaxID=1081109 RepID=A0A162I1P0_9HYPO|nr:ankyrin repeat-containing protein [Moelleriella libera RCEF 2490]
MASSDLSQLLLLAITVILTFLLTHVWSSRERWLPVKKKVSTRKQPGPRTYRIRGVPLGWSETDLAEHLGDSAQVKSLASEDDGRKLIATATFASDRPELQSGSPLKTDKEFLGLTTLSAPNDAKLDIIAVPGLGGHAFGSFKECHGEHMWLRDSLPNDLQDTPARIMVYGYDSSLRKRNSIQCLSDIASEFRDNLLQFKRTPRPIIFIGHSLGGLVIKRALVSIWDLALSDPELRPLARAVYGIFFFGVPHDGMEITALRRVVKDSWDRALVESLSSKNSESLSSLSSRFKKSIAEFPNLKVHCFYETEFSPTVQEDDRGELVMDGVKELLVNVESARNCGESAHSPDFSSPIRGVTPYRSAAPYQPLVEECLKSLSFPTIFMRIETIDSATENTCQWLFNHPSYKQWEASSRGILLVRGHPGSGKSTLLRHAFKKSSQNPSNHIIASFFFHGRGEELQKSHLGLFRSLIHQLLKQVPPDAFQSLLKKFNDRRKTVEKWDWVLNDLKSFFKDCLPHILKHQTLLLFIDALDESIGPDRPHGLIRFFQNFFCDNTEQDQNFRILLSCRHFPEIGEVDFEINPERENQEDISLYVKKSLRQFLTGEDATKISKLIKARARGSFMWARLVIDRLHLAHLEGQGYEGQNLEGQDLKFIRGQIEKTPQDLEELYEELVEKMPDKPEALRMIQWIAFARRPLDSHELYWAMLIDPNKPRATVQEYREDARQSGMSEYNRERMRKRVKALTCGLAEALTEESRCIVQFIHQSVNDFFLNKSKFLDHEQYFPGNIERSIPQIAHELLYRTCIICFELKEFRELKFQYRLDIRLVTKEQEIYPLMHYARMNWSFHLKKSVLNRENRRLAWPSHDSLNALEQYRFQMMRINGRASVDGERDPCAITTCAHEASRHGIIDWLEEILQNSESIDSVLKAKDYRGQTPLNVAAGEGQKAIVELLLKVGDDVNSPNLDGETPLFKAAAWGHEATVQSLLRVERVNVNLCDRFSRTPLARAVEKGRKAIVQSLLQVKGVNVNLSDGHFRTPLAVAAEKGHEAIVQSLLQVKGVDVNLYDRYFRTPLARAVEKGHEAIVQSLLRVEAVDVNLSDWHFRTPLARAAEKGHEAIVQSLLQVKGVNVNLSDGHFRTPLARAAEKGHEAIVQSLLRVEAVDVNLSDGHFRTPLARAAEKGHEAIVQSLLRVESVDVNLYDRHFRTPLARAAEKGHEAIVQSLLRVEAVDVNLSDGHFRTPLARAAAKGHEAIIQSLLRVKAVDVNLSDRHFRTPLTRAAEKGHEAIIQSLLRVKAVDVNLSDGHFRTPLIRAAEKGHEAIIQSLLQVKGVNNNLCDHDILTLLAVAAEHDHAASFKLLYYYSFTNNTNEDSICIGVRHGRPGLVDWLLYQQSNLGERNNDLFKARLLEAAASNYSFGTEIVSMLLERGEDQIVVTEKTFQAALANGVSGFRILKLLLGHQGDQICTAKDALSAASYKKNNLMFRWLLKQRENEIRICQYVVRPAAKDEYDNTLLRLLLKYRGDQLAQEALWSAIQNAANNERLRLRNLRLLLRFLGDRPFALSVNFHFLIKKRHGLKFVRLLLKNREEKILVSKKTVLDSLASYYNAGDPFHGPGTRRKIELLARKLNEDNYGLRYLRLLLKHRGDHLVVTRKMVRGSHRDSSTRQRIYDWLLHYADSDSESCCSASSPQTDCLQVSESSTSPDVIEE